MANTYTKIYIHIVFAVSGRVNFIRSDMREEIHRYMTGIVQNKGHKLIAINGMPDHVHLLVGLKPDMAVSGLVHDLKVSSTRFMNEKGWFGGRYAWQSGYGAFSYSRSQLDTVAQYILTQELHHAKVTFRQEYKALLRKFEVSYEDRYLFEFYDS